MIDVLICLTMVTILPPITVCCEPQICTIKCIMMMNECWVSLQSKMRAKISPHSTLLSNIAIIQLWGKKPGRRGKGRRKPGSMQGLRPRGFNHFSKIKKWGTENDLELLVHLLNLLPGEQRLQWDCFLSSAVSPDFRGLQQRDLRQEKETGVMPSTTWEREKKKKKTGARENEV